jgi:hypothetical protein
MYFGLIKVHCYQSTSTRIKKEAATEAAEQSEAVGKKRRASEPPLGQRPSKTRAVDAYSGQSTVRIKKVPAKSFLDEISLATSASSREGAKVRNTRK